MKTCPFCEGRFECPGPSGCRSPTPAEPEDCLLPPSFKMVVEKLPEDGWTLEMGDGYLAVVPLDPISRNVLPMMPSPYGDLAQTLIRRRKSGQPPAA